MTKEMAIDEMGVGEIAGLCDHTYLNRAEAFRGERYAGKSAVVVREEEFSAFLQSLQKLAHKPYAVCVRAEEVARVHEFLLQHGLQEIVIASVVGFPDGCHVDTRFKVLEAEYALDAGAREIDMVLHYEALKAGDMALCTQDIEAVVAVVHKGQGLVKLIIETCELTAPQIREACRLAEHCGVDFVKTSTGFGAYGARREDVAVIAQAFSRGIKISGGVKMSNVHELLSPLGRDGRIPLDPHKIRIGESSLLP